VLPQAQHDEQDDRRRPEAQERRGEQAMLFSTMFTAGNTPLQNTAISTSFGYSIFCAAC
jgi:hypothetical protein